MLFILLLMLHTASGNNCNVPDGWEECSVTDDNGGCSGCTPCHLWPATDFNGCIARDGFCQSTGGTDGVGTCIRKPCTVPDGWEECNDPLSGSPCCDGCVPCDPAKRDEKCDEVCEFDRDPCIRKEIDDTPPTGCDLCSTQKICENHCGPKDCKNSGRVITCTMCDGRCVSIEDPLKPCYWECSEPNRNTKCESARTVIGDSVLDDTCANWRSFCSDPDVCKPCDSNEALSGCYFDCDGNCVYQDKDNPETVGECVKVCDPIRRCPDEDEVCKDKDSCGNCEPCEPNSTDRRWTDWFPCYWDDCTKKCVSKRLDKHSILLTEYDWIECKKCKGEDGRDIPCKSPSPTDNPTPSPTPVTLKKCPPPQNEYIATVVDVAVDWSTAQEYCRSEFNSDLATVVDQEDMQRALEVIGDCSAWIGLRSKHRAGFFEFVDETPCPPEHNGRFNGVCSDPSIYKYGHPMKCTQGGRMCVNLSSQEGKINNNIHCDEGLKCILCNCANSAEGNWVEPYHQPN